MNKFAERLKELRLEANLTQDSSLKKLTSVKPQFLNMKQTLNLQR